jgi:microcystin degradation protein MlrC
VLIYYGWGGAAQVGMAFVVITHDDAAAAERIATELAATAWARREEFVCELATPRQAVSGPLRSLLAIDAPSVHRPLTPVAALWRGRWLRR